MMSNSFNIDKNMVMKLIVMLVPFLGALTNKRGKDGADTRGIASLIDQNREDQIIDDVAGMLFKRLDSQSSISVASILGSLSSEVMQPHCQKCGSSI